MTTWAHKAGRARAGMTRPATVRMMRVGRSPGVITCLVDSPVPAIASDARARTYSSHQQAATAPTATQAPSPATTARAAGRAASASRS
ncbi:MAG: hypothetical protein M3179_04995, partial [Actinomycetota bacterium]|nr:hypothetical protein [Actinomycetota bacterium]